MNCKAVVTGALLVGALFGASAARAETCPATPDEASLRRALAKEWFARAEDSEAGGERDAAVRQYACSLKMVPHPATAYNLAVAAERSGDPSMAADAFRAYLRLMPDAHDRSPTELRIARLESHISDLRRQFEDNVPRHNTRAKVSTPPPAPRLTLERDPDLLPPLPMPEPPGNDRRVPPWPVVGGAVAAGSIGLIFNLVARAKMTTCRDRQLRATDPAAANDACSSARPYAYGSYALLGLGAALGATGAILIFRDTGPEGTALSIEPSPDGATVGISGGF